MGWLKNRREREQHNDRDVLCKHWWGDRSGSVMGVMNERCMVCNPLPEIETNPWRAYDDERYSQAGR